MTSGPGGQTVDLRSNLTTLYGKIFKKAMEYFCALLALLVHDLRRQLSEIVGLSRIIVKFVTFDDLL